MSDVLGLTAEAALAEWGRRVRLNREQSERRRERPPSADFYQPLAASFRADPRRTGEPALEALRALVGPGETWLDVGAGGGRYALPLALRAKEVIALDHSQAMLEVLRTAMAEEGIANVRVVQSSWPAAEPMVADVALISHVGYDIEAIGPFLEAMERSARRLCVAVLVDGSPSRPSWQFWPAVHGEDRHPLPGLREFLALQLARGRLCDVRLLEREPQSYGSPEGIERWIRQQLFTAEGSDKDRALMALVRDAMVEEEGRWALSWERTPLGVVTWPGGAR